jgi:hypothetical protein
MNERDAWAAWSDAIADRVEHQDDCSLRGGGCSAPFSTRVALCPIGEQLGAVEEAAHQTWRASRQAQTKAVAS